MATVTHGIQTGSTSNVTSYAAGTFTPVAGDLLICMVEATDTSAVGSVSSTGNTAAWQKIAIAPFSASVNTCYLFVQTALAAATATIVTFDCTGDAATGAVVCVTRVAGMTRTGASAIRQVATLNNKIVVTISTPLSSPDFSTPCLTGNPTIEFAGNGQGDTYQPPTNWTEGVADTVVATPASGFEYHFRNSGFTGTNIGWADTVGFSNTTLGIIAFELDTSSGTSRLATQNSPTLQAVNRAGTF